MPQPVLNRFDITVLKNKAANDFAQVPAASATVAFYRPGATAKTLQSIPVDATDVTIPVYDTGSIVAEDMVRVGASGPSLIVQSVPDSTTLIVQNGSGSAVTIAAGARLLLTSRRPKVYLDPVGTTQAASSALLTDAFGAASAYLSVPRLDYVVSGSGVTTRIYADVRPGPVAGDPGWVNANGYDSLQDALDACAAGGRLYLPAGNYTVPSGGLKIRKSIELFGDGPQATILHPNSPQSGGQPVLVIEAGSGLLRNIHVHDLKLTGAGNTYGRSGREDNHGITCVCTEDAAPTDLRLERVIAENMSGDGFHFEGVNYGAGAIVFIYGMGLQAIECQGSGFYIEYATVVEMHSCYANASYLFGAHCRRSMVAWYASAFENNCRATSATLAKPGDSSTIYDADRGAQLLMQWCIPGRVDACDFESFTSTPTNLVRLAQNAIVVEDCAGSVISNCSFWSPAGAGIPTAPESTLPMVSGRGIFVAGDAGTGWVSIFPNQFTNVATPVEVSSSTVAVSVHPQRVLQGEDVGATCALIGVPGLAIPVLPTTQIAGAIGADGQLIFDSSTRRLQFRYEDEWHLVLQL